MKTQSSAVETRVTRREEELRSQREALQNRVAQLEVALHVERESRRKEREAMQNKILQLEATIGELYTTIRGYQHSLGLRHVLQTHADRNARI